MKIFSLLFFFLITSSLMAEEYCETCAQGPRLPSAGAEKLFNDVEKAISKNFVKIADLKVNHGGTGDLSLLVDSNGKVLAVKFNYKDGKDVKNFTVTIDEFNQGKGIEYPAQTKAGVSPLKLSAVIPPGVNGTSGGNFKLTIATSLDPVKTKDAIINLKKSGDRWFSEANNKEIKKVKLEPGISMFSWTGTFEEVNFE